MVKITKAWKEMIIQIIGSDWITPLEIAHEACEWYGPVEPPN